MSNIHQRLVRLEANAHASLPEQKCWVTQADLECLYDRLEAERLGLPKPPPTWPSDPEAEALVNDLWEQLCKQAKQEPAIAQYLRLEDE